ncbi:unnamed protein product, partial [Polarella glacialis]
VGEDAALSPALVELVAFLAEEKFGEGSEEHLKALRELADACGAIGRPGLAAPVRAALARILREQCATSSCVRSPGAWAEADAQAAEEEAAQALEALAGSSLEEGDLEAAATAWAEALAFRELSVGAEGSELVASMRISLEALQQAAASKSASEDARDADSEGEERKESEEEKEQEEEQQEPEEEQQEEEQEEEEEPVAAASRPPAKSLLSLSSQPMGLRPAWAKPSPGSGSAQGSGGYGSGAAGVKHTSEKDGPQADNDAWDD